MEDVQAFVKMLTAETNQTALDAELESDLGYSKYDYKNKQTNNSRNGYSQKTVQGSLGEMEKDIPRDRNGEFEPQLVKKHQTDVSGIEDKVIFLYSQGVSTRDIQKTMAEMYGIDVDDSRVSKITDKLLPVIREWQERPLQSVYAMLILDAVHYSKWHSYEKGGICGDWNRLRGQKRCAWNLAGSHRIVEILAECADWVEKPRRQRYTDCVSGRFVRFRGSYLCGLSADRGSALRHSSDSRFRAVCILQRYQDFHGGFEAHLQGHDRRNRLGGAGRAGKQMGQ
jgi:hypothetical protein